MKRHLPWYKRCPADWQKGTRRHNMSFELRGFYSECLDAMWELQGELPKDAKALAMMLGSNPRKVRALMTELIALGKMIETEKGYYNPRMMADITGSDEHRTRIEPASNQHRKSKKPQSFLRATLEAEAEEEEEKRESAGARRSSSFWTEALNPQDGARLTPDGQIVLANATRSRWAEAFGGEDRLRLALLQAAQYVEPHGRRPLLVRVEAQLARQLADLKDRDRRYVANRRPDAELPAKPKPKIMDLIRASYATG